MGDTFGSFASGKLDVLLNGISGPEFRKTMAAAAKEAQKIAERSASADLGGDPKFSGWKPPLDTKIVFVGDRSVRIQPTARSAGPWTVAERGRNQGDAGGFAGPSINRSTGSTIRTKKGRIRKTSQKSRRWNGYTQGKGTASTAVAGMQQALPPIIDDGVKKAIRRAGL